MVQMIALKGWCDMDNTKKGIIEIALAVIVFILLLSHYQAQAQRNAVKNAYNEGYMTGYEQGWTDNKNDEYYLPEKGLK